MAGDPTPIVNTWILDYNTYFAWEEFKLDHSLSSSTLDSISGILSKTWEGDERGSDKKLFLTVLSRLKDGEDINMRYDEASEVTPLEDLVPHFMNLVNLQIDEKLLQEGELLLKVIKCEAVQACCRAGEFEKARAIFDGFFKQDKKDKIAKTLKGQISKKNTETDLSYADFITAMVEYLEQIAASFQEPTIITAARMFMERKRCGRVNGEKQNGGVDRVPQREILDKVQENGCNNNSTSTDRKKLRRLWDSKIKDIFGSESPKESRTGVDTSPFKKPTSTSGMSSKTSKHKNPDPVDSSSPFKKPSRSDRSPLQTSRKEYESVNSKKSFEKPSTSSQALSTPKKDAQVSNISPVKRVSASGSCEDDSTTFSYRKNKGRHDRHEPVMSSTRCEVDDDSDDMEVSSVFGHSRRKWTDNEMNEFYDAVQTFGVGKWSKIREYLNTTRTSVMLKDKWRNMVKSGDADKIRKQRKKKTV